MKPAPFSYHAAASVKEAVDLLGDLGAEARPLAGGQSLLPMMNFRIAQPAHLVDVNPVAELDYIRAEGDEVAIGARTRQSTLERSGLVAERLPLLIEAVRQVAFPTIRHRGTVGGSVAHADPAGELPTAMLALEAEIVAAAQGRTRRIAAGDFFQAPYETALETGELLTEVRVKPWPAGTGWAFVEFLRAYHGFAVVGAGALVLVEGGRIERAAVALCGVGGAPVRAGAAEAHLVGSAPTTEVIAEAGALAAEGLEPPGDVHGSGAYRKKLAAVFVRRALTQAVERAGASG